VQCKDIDVGNLDIVIQQRTTAMYLACEIRLEMVSRRAVDLIVVYGSMVRSAGTCTLDALVILDSRSFDLFGQNLARNAASPFSEVSWRERRE
jgi:hypothetical protein